MSQIVTQEYREQFDAHKKEYNKLYRETHKEEISARMKEYYKNNRDEKLAKDKVRQEINKEQIATRRKERYEANRDEVLAKQSIKLTCGCGSTFRQSDRARHERTKKHTTWSA